MAILDERQIEEIRKHKYQAEGKSILEPFFIPIWEYIAAKTPRRISQHAVTLIGIVASILPCSVLLYFAYYGDTKVNLTNFSKCSTTTTEVYRRPEMFGIVGQFSLTTYAWSIDDLSRYSKCIYSTVELPYNGHLLGQFYCPL